MPAGFLFTGELLLDLSVDARLVRAVKHAEHERGVARDGQKGFGGGGSWELARGAERGGARGTRSEKRRNSYYRARRSYLRTEGGGCARGRNPKPLQRCIPGMVPPLWRRRSSFAAPEIKNEIKKSAFRRAASSAVPGVVACTRCHTVLVHGSSLG